MLNITHYQFSSVQISSSVMSDSLGLHELQHARPPCPPPSPGVHSDSRPFLIGSFIFLELSCRNCLYIFEINSLSVASFAIIFSHSECCLSPLLIGSIVVQKLLILIRSHLFIFAFISKTLGGGS